MNILFNDWIQGILKKDDKKAFDNMFSIARLYNSACSYAANPIRTYPIMMSIFLYSFYFYFYQMLLLLI